MPGTRGGMASVGTWWFGRLLCLFLLADPCYLILTLLVTSSTEAKDRLALAYDNRRRKNNSASATKKLLMGKINCFTAFFRYRSQQIKGISSREATYIWMSVIVIWTMPICGENRFLIGSFPTKFRIVRLLSGGRFRQLISDKDEVTN